MIHNIMHAHSVDVYPVRNVDSFERLGVTWDNELGYLLNPE